MESLFRYLAPPSPCGYLPDRLWSLEYEIATDISAEDYATRMLDGWRRFGAMLFHPQCPACQACQPIRVDVARFRPNRSQRRVLRMNEGQLHLEIDKPKVTRTKLNLYDRFHAFQANHKGWPEHAPKDAESYRDSFVNNPDFTEEWCYYLADRLVGVGYVDRLPIGLSAIYFVYEPTLREHSLGTWNVLQILNDARQAALPHVYLGYFVKGCGSLEYKAGYRPNQIRTADGAWQDFLDIGRE